MTQQPVRPVRIAIAGLDHWYTAIPLAQAVAGHPEAELVGIADANETRARQVASKLGARSTTSPDELLDDADVVAAYGSTDQNPAVCVAAAEKGVHIVSVKPFARTLESAERVVSAVRKASVGFLPSESRARTVPLQRRLREWVSSGALGEPLTATFRMSAPLPRSWPGSSEPGWFVDGTRVPGGGWIDHAIYFVDRLRWVLGSEVASITGRTTSLRHTGLSVEDYGDALVLFDNGVQASISADWIAPDGGFRHAWSITGTTGAVSYDNLHGRISLLGDMHEFDGWAHIDTGAGFPEGIDDIVALVRAPSSAVAGVEDAWRNLAACLAFYEASSAGGNAKPAPLPA